MNLISFESRLVWEIPSYYENVFQPKIFPIGIYETIDSVFTQQYQHNSIVWNCALNITIQDINLTKTNL